jgi:hypothetical protein
MSVNVDSRQRCFGPLSSNAQAFTNQRLSKAARAEGMQLAAALLHAPPGPTSVRTNVTVPRCRVRGWGRFHVNVANNK